jgi:hypothetical protein
MLFAASIALVSLAAVATDLPSLQQLAECGAAVAAANPIVAAARKSELDPAYRYGFDIATCLCADPSDGGLGGAVASRDEPRIRRALDDAAQEGFGAAKTLLRDDYPLRSETIAVDAGVVALRVSEYRATRDLSPVTADPTLTAIAELHARRMASADRLEHVLPGEGSFGRRLEDGAFRSSLAVENIAAGTRTLGEVLDLWRRSPRHDANLLRDGVVKLGVGVAWAPDSRYRIYWCLVLARGESTADQDATAATTGTNHTP